MFFIHQGPKNDCLIYFKYWFHKLLSRNVLQPTMNLKYSYVFLCMKGVWQGVLLCHVAGCHRWCIDCPYGAAKCTLQSCEIFRYFRPLKNFKPYNLFCPKQHKTLILTVSSWVHWQTWKKHWGSHIKYWNMINKNELNILDRQKNWRKKSIGVSTVPHDKHHQVLEHLQTQWWPSLCICMPEYQGWF